MMKFAWIGALCLVLLSACAGLRQETLLDCTRDSALARGNKDGKAGRNFETSFIRACSLESKDLAQISYHEANEAARAKRKLELGKSEPVEEEEATLSNEPMPDFSSARELAAISWVCEVEANSKVFTGVGANRDEALGSARASCGSHLQASYCTKSDCKQNL